MQTDKIDLQTAFRNNTVFCRFLAQEARAENPGQAGQNPKSVPHPAGEVLYDWVLDRLEAKAARFVMEHIVLCGECAHETLIMMQMEDELEQDWLEWADIDGEEEEQPDIRTPVLTDSQIRWVSELWEPQRIDQFASAAEVPKQVRLFVSEEAEIRVSLSWQGADQQNSAFIHMKWSADMAPGTITWLRFINPATRAIRHATCLGTQPAGTVILTPDDLGFDPSYERWAIAVILAEPE